MLVNNNNKGIGVVCVNNPSPDAMSMKTGIFLLHFFIIHNDYVIVSK